MGQALYCAPRILCSYNVHWFSLWPCKFPSDAPGSSCNQKTDLLVTVNYPWCRFLGGNWGEGEIFMCINDEIGYRKIGGEWGWKERWQNVVNDLLCCKEVSDIIYLMGQTWMIVPFPASGQLWSEISSGGKRVEYRHRIGKVRIIHGWLHSLSACMLKMEEHMEETDHRAMHCPLYVLFKTFEHHYYSWVRQGEKCS